MKAFKLIPQLMGSGCVSLHVAVDYWHSWPDKNPETANEIILTIDAQNFEEVAAKIDILIAELNDLKEQAKRKFGEPKS